MSIDVESPNELLDKGMRPVSVDLRPAPEHRLGRLPGARSIPLHEIERRWAELRHNRMVVLYRACPAHKLTPAYHLLRRQGYRHLLLLQDGVGAWTARGYPLER